MPKKIGYLKQSVVFGLLMIILISIYMLALHYVKIQRDLENLIPDDFRFVFQIDDARTEDDIFFLEGWAFRLESDASKKDMEFWLYDLDEKEIVYPKKTKFSSREDVNNYFLCEYDYSDCGIVAGFDKEELDFVNKDYQILVSDNVNLKVYQTETYLAKGQLMYCSPEDYVCLDVEGTELEEIVNNGILRVYRPDFGMYVYQYEGELYWIAELDYGFVDEDTIVQFQMDTTQIEKLPEDRLSTNRFWSSISFRFKAKELADWNTGKYRVSKDELPTAYSITNIWTGNHIDEWIWKQYFRPWYVFSE